MHRDPSKLSGCEGLQVREALPYAVAGAAGYGLGLQDTGRGPRTVPPVHPSGAWSALPVYKTQYSSFRQIIYIS